METVHALYINVQMDCSILTPFASYKTNTHHQLLLQHAETWLLPEITRGLLALRKQHNHQTTDSRHSQTAHSSRDASSCFLNIFAQQTTNHVKAKLQQPVVYKKQPVLSGVHRHSDKHATGKIPKAQCAFKILMIHEVLQFALRIAFRCVLHRCGNLDIHR